MSESLAKMKLKPFATEADVDEALRLFQVSTLDAAMSGNLSGKLQQLIMLYVDCLLIVFCIEINSSHLIP